MPLQEGSSQSVISSNISELESAGHDHDQSVAIALSEAGKMLTTKTKRYMGIKGRDSSALNEDEKLLEDFLNGIARVISAVQSGGQSEGLHELKKLLSQRSMFQSEKYAPELKGIDALVEDAINSLLKAQSAVWDVAEKFDVTIGRI